MWFRLIEIVKKPHYMCQILSQSDEWCQKWRGVVPLTPQPPPPPPMPSSNRFELMPSSVNLNEFVKSSASSSAGLT